MFAALALVLVAGCATSTRFDLGGQSLWTHCPRDGMCEVRSRSGLLLARGALRNGVPDGAWKLLATDGTPVAEGTFSDGKMNGPWEFYRFGRSDLYASHKRALCLRFYAGGKARTKETEHAKGSFDHGAMTGKWVVAHGDTRIEASFGGERLHECSVYDGAFRKFSHDVLVREGTYDDGAATGTWKTYYASGALKSRTDMADSTVVWLFENGVVKARGKATAIPGSIADGLFWHETLPLAHHSRGEWSYKPHQKLDGTEVPAWGKPCPKGTELSGSLNAHDVEQWCQLPPDDEGVHKKEGPYRLWSLTGNPILVGQYADGERDGHWLHYWPGGALWEDAHYEHGKRSGSFESFTTDGVLAKKGQYVDDEKDGEWLYYNSNGQVERKEHFDHGKKR